MNFLFLATFFRGLEAEKSWERVRLKIVIIIIGRKRGRAERERERLAVEPTLENIDIDLIGPHDGPNWPTVGGYPPFP